MHCHSGAEGGALAAGGSVALVGQPNVGKSALFQKLTGQRVTVSNYPGTTVELTRGTARALPGVNLVDTPGVVAFPPYSDDERVTAHLLLNEPLQAVLQVGDAKNLRRTLLLTVQLAEMQIPLALALNMTDEAERRGVKLDRTALEAALGIPVAATAAVRGDGMEALAEALKAARPSSLQLAYPAEIEAALAEAQSTLEQAGMNAAPVALRSLLLLWLSGDTVSEQWLAGKLDAGLLGELNQQRAALAGGPPAARIQQARLAFVEQLSGQATLERGQSDQGLAGRLGRLTTHPVWGWGVLAVVLYALYWFVGIFGAGTLVGLLEEGLFEQILNPAITALVQATIPFPLIQDLLVGPFGLWTMGMTYALALILPIVVTFFLAFGVLEDSGYLPRLAALSNRAFSALGLNGKAVLPMVLGLGCVTMATVTTRVLESRRERFLATLLLALAVPCSAQLGVVMGMLAAVSFSAVMIWGGVILLVLLLVGWLAARLAPGERSLLLVELPPLRLPQFSNVAIKTLARLEWYVKEVVPVFLFGTALMFTLDRLGVLDTIIQLGEPLVTGWLGLPAQASAAFLMGFLRRDFGASGLFVMQSQGMLTPVQVVVAMVTITLFIPCIASVMMIAKERSWRTALGMTALITPLALLVGGLLYRALLLLGWNG